MNYKNYILKNYGNRLGLLTLYDFLVACSDLNYSFRSKIYRSGFDFFYADDYFNYNNVLDFISQSPIIDCLFGDFSNVIVYPYSGSIIEGHFTVFYDYYFFDFYLENNVVFVSLV